MNEVTRESPAVALALGFAPSAIVVYMLSSGPDELSDAMLWLMFVVGAVCCFTSAFMLFRGNARWVIALSLVLLLVLLWGFTGQNYTSLAVLWAMFLVCVVCCLTSSFLLFRRKTAWAIVGGLILLLLNGT